MHLVNCITINTDASFNQQYKVGGYAFYIICDLFKIQKSGAFKKEPKTAMDAEMMCMANALHTLFTQKELPSTKWIIINSDCLGSFNHIKRRSKHNTGKYVAKILRKIRLRSVNNQGVLPKISFRHVKAHNGTPDSRSFVNNWCDKEANKWMKKAVIDTKTKLT